MLMGRIFTYHFVFGFFLLLSGMFFFLVMASPLRDLGIVLTILAYIYLARISYSFFHDTDEDHFRSRIRDAMMKNLLKR